MKNTDLNTCVALAAAITSYARISIYKFVSMESTAYTDTDSIYSTKQLPAELIGDNLGQMKFEFAFDEALFVKPKIYFTRLGDNSNFKFFKPDHFETNSKIESQ